MCAGGWGCGGVGVGGGGVFFFFFSSRRRHTRLVRDWSSDVCSSDLGTRRIDLREQAQSIGYPVVEIDDLESITTIAKNYSPS